MCTLLKRGKQFPGYSLIQPHWPAPKICQSCHWPPCTTFARSQTQTIGRSLVTTGHSSIDTCLPAHHSVYVSSVKHGAETTWQAFYCIYQGTTYRWPMHLEPHKEVSHTFCYLISKKQPPVCTTTAPDRATSIRSPVTYIGDLHGQTTTELQNIVSTVWVVQLHIGQHPAPGPNINPAHAQTANITLNYCKVADMMSSMHAGLGATRAGASTLPKLTDV